MLNSYTAILDYDCGNTESIQNALRVVGQDSVITSDKLKIKSDIIEKMVFEFYYFKITGS